MKKKVVCIVLSVLLLLAAFPVTAADNGVAVTLTVTHGEGLYSADGVLLAAQPLTVPYFDLALYGLADYYYNPDCYTGASQTGGTAQTANGVVTLLHLLLFATEVCKCGLSPADAGKGFLTESGTMDDYLSVSGNPGSAFLSLWDLETNLNYFVNRAMPLGKEGWMSTIDQIALKNGDSVQVHGITGASYGTNIRAFQTGDIFDAATVQKDQSVTLLLTHRQTDYATMSTAAEPLSGETVYCAKADSAGGNVRAWKQLGVTSKSGTITVSASSLGAGTYYIATAGSDDKTAGMQNAPAVFRLTVDGSAPAENVPVTIGGLHEMQVQSVKLYTFTNLIKGTTDLLQGLVPTDGRIETVLPTGDYWLDGYDADGRYNGGVCLRLTKDNSAFTVQRVYDLHATNSDFVEGTDYSIYVTVTAPDGTNRRAVCGKADNYGTLRTSCLFLLGDTVRASFVPLGDKAETYLPASAEKLPTINTSLTATLYVQTDFTVTAPAGSTVSAGRFASYYLYTFYEPTAEKTLDDGRIQVSFRLPQERVNATGSPKFFYRVQHPTGVTYWNFFDPSKTQSVEVTAEQIYRDNETCTSKTVLHNYEQNTYDTADIYLNGTKSGCISLQAGESFSLNAFRNWMAIENFYNAKVALPDMHYRVIDENGNDSDLLTVTPDKYNSCQAAVKANGTGTAILLVTYDAMFSEQSYKSGKANRPNLFSAIWPENTGVLVFRVGDDSEIETNMFLNGTGKGYELDAEHDPLYYTSGDGASYTFTPEAGCTVSVARPVVTREMTFKPFTTDGVETNADGSVTLTGLLHGRNIVKIEKNGGATYQVITAKQMSYTLLDADGDPLGDTPLHAGDTVQIQYTGLYNPVEKMSGVYNHNARIRFKGEDGTKFESVPGGAWGVYDFSGNPERQKLTVTIPTYWQGGTYTLSGGVIAMKISGSAAGAHRGVAYGRGMDPNFSAQSGGAAQGYLPDITLTLEKTDFLTATFSITDTDGETVDLSDVTVEIKDADGKPVPLSDDGTFPVFAGEYTYTVTGEGYEDAEDSFTIAEGGETVSVVLTKIVEPEQKDSVWQKIARFFRMVWLYLTHPVQFFRMLWQKLRERLGR